MDIGEIVKDSLKYPLSNWKSYLILGIIIVFTNLYADIGELIPDSRLISALKIIGFIIGLFIYGYMFKIIKSSLGSINELPEFNGLVKIFIDGLKVVIAVIVYLIPVFLIFLVGLFFGLIRFEAYGISGSPILIIFLYMIVIIISMKYIEPLMIHLTISGKNGILR